VCARKTRKKKALLSNLFVDASEVDRHAELVVLHLCSGYALGLFEQRLVHLIVLKHNRGRFLSVSCKLP
jgi:hypothetical protein